MRLKYVLWLQTDFYGEEGGQNGSFDNKGLLSLVLGGLSYQRSEMTAFLM